MRKITKWNYKNENEITGAKPYIRLQDKIIRETKENSFKIIEKEGNNLMNIVSLAIIWISSTFNFYLISKNLEHQNTELFWSVITSSIADCIGFTIGFLIHF